jgi:two-component sensor histidine kinase
MTGGSVFDIGGGEWNSPKLRSFLNATINASADIVAYDFVLERLGASPRQLVLNARVLVHAEASALRLLLTVSDVTEARLSEKLQDDLLREKAVLLQEVQHRVANSLQIIASVLLQSARQVQSEETRSHLKDAHHRVMSIASVQKQLATSSARDVELRPYFEQLCQSLGASMIRDHNLQSIDATTDESRVSADVSVSLGLIVTELVINALKHAFPGGRPGRIAVRYDSLGDDWELIVRDDGIGMPIDGRPAKPGLGSGIVEALARQLKSEVVASDAHPGTIVSITHHRKASLPEEAKTPLAL